MDAVYWAVTTMIWPPSIVRLHAGARAGGTDIRLAAGPLGGGCRRGGILIAGFAHIYKGVTAGFRRWFSASPWAMLWIDPVSRFGLIARGLLFLPVGCFVVYAAITLKADQARGLEGALLWVQELAFGRLLLGIAGIGLVAFGVYSVIETFVCRVGFGAGTAGPD